MRKFRIKFKINKLFRNNYIKTQVKQILVTNMINKMNKIFINKILKESIFPHKVLKFHLILLLEFQYKLIKFI